MSSPHLYRVYSSIQELGQDVLCLLLPAPLLGGGVTPLELLPCSLPRFPPQQADGCVLWGAAQLRSSVVIKYMAASCWKALHKSQVLWLIIIYGNLPRRDSPSIQAVIVQQGRPKNVGCPWSGRGGWSQEGKKGKAEHHGRATPLSGCKCARPLLDTEEPTWGKAFDCPK